MKYLLSSLLFVVLFCALSCQKKSEISTREEVKEYFSAYTQGTIYENDPFIFRLISGPVVISKNLKTGIHIQPAHDISVTYDSARHEIKITPESPWERGKEYQISIDLGKVIDKADAGTYRTTFLIHKQEVDVMNKGLRIKEDGQSFTLLEVFTALPENSGSIQTIFNYPEEKIEIEELSPTHFSAQLKMDSNEDTQVVKWDASSLSSDDNGVVNFYSFDENSFEVVKTHYDRSKKQFHIYFSQLIASPKEDAGLVTLDDEATSFEIENNILSVYVNTNSKESITLKVDKSLSSKKGLNLSTILSYEVDLEIVRPAVEWLSEGTYIPANGDFKIPFQARGLRSVIVQVIKTPSENTSRFAAWNELSNLDLMEIKRYGRLEIEKTIELTSSDQAAETWAEYGLDLSQLFSRENGMVYTILLSFNPSNTILDCDDAELKEFEARRLEADFFDEPYGYFYANNYYNRRRQDPCKKSYYYNHPSIIKNVHCTSVFPIIKMGGNKTLVAVKELSTNEVAANAEVTLLNLQGLAIAKKKASAEGFVWFDSPSSAIRAVKIEYEGESSYYNVSQNNVLSLTEFDVSSQSRDIDSRLFVYAERDIWRPGDSIFLDVMLNDSRFEFEQGLPISVKLFNPKNVLSYSAVKNIDQSSIYSFVLPTNLDAPTGYWFAKVKVGPHTKRFQLRVETIKPNVVEATYDIDSEENGWIYSNTLRGEVSVDYLAGYPMKKGKVSAGVVVQTVSQPFEEYRGFTFTSKSRVSPYDNENFFSVTTDDLGKSSFNTSFDFKSMNTVSRLVLDSKIDLPGGGLNTQTRGYMVSPFDQYVGIKMESGEGWRGSFKYGEKPRFELIHLDQRGKPVNGSSTADVEVYRYERDWWYDRYRLSRPYNYHNNEKRVLRWEETASFENGTYTFNHNTDTLSSGLYIIVVTDRQSGHQASYSYHVVTSEDYTAATNPELLEIKTDKEEYRADEDIVVDLPQIPGAKALISIEVGETIHDVFWTDLNSPSLRITPEDSWTPNIYINMHVVQPYAFSGNDRPMRMYAVKKVRINSSATPLAPKIAAPEKSLPNTPLAVTVSEEGGQAMEYTISVVDEGLLNITGFQTPDPQTHFNKLIALRIKTWDIFKDLIHYLNPSFAGIISIGGDAALKAMLDESADFNRFEPVVFHAGPFTLNDGEKKKHSFDIPNYIGRLRVMVVGKGKTQFGHADEGVRIASPLMLQTQLPRALNVGDIVQVPVTLFKDESSISQVEVKAGEPSGKVTFMNENQTINLSQQDQFTSTMQMEVGEKVGEANIEFSAASGKYSANEATKIFINFPNGYSSESKYFSLAPGATQTFDVSSFGFPSTQNLDIVVSGILLPDFTTMYKDLIEYPHGCLEQLTSRCFAMLYTNGLLPLTPQEENKRLDYLDAGITKIQSYQESSGQFKYWPTHGSYNAWADVYAGFLLYEAKELGHRVSEESLKNWIQNATGKANAWRIQGTMQSAYWVKREEHLQALRLYVLARAGHAQKGAMNRFRQRNELSSISGCLLAGAYHHAGLQDMAKSLLGTHFNQNQNRYYYWGSSVRTDAIKIMIASSVNPDLITKSYFRDWVERVNKRRWLSTQEKGFCFMACHAFYGDKTSSDEIEIQISSEKFSERQKYPATSSRRYHWDHNEMNGTATITNHGEGEINIHRVERAISTNLYPQPESNGVALSVSYRLPSGESAVGKVVDQGEEIQIEIDVSNSTAVNLDDLALSLKMPSGWELLNPRIFNSAKLISDYSNYQDYRDDRVYTYFTLSKSGKNSSKTFRFKARAQLKGEFYLPAVSVTDMYDLDINARTTAQRVEVQ